ncbi:MAG: isocitrate lyase/PEP mutase family protein [Caulobacterales bacterium]|nr:isocitrate lyase/PEP mutase family protein [Caulobacterales bacterium]
MAHSSAAVRAAFRARLAEPRIITAPGVFDALSALLAEQAGFEAIFLSGSAMSYSQLARPDIGLVTLPELVDAAARIAERVSIPLIADVDSGFGAAPHAARMIRAFERAGAAAVQIEDQQVVKPPGALTSRPLTPIAEMTGKIKAMADARQSETMLISARTDAAPVSVDDAVARAAAYRAAGADLIFAEGMTKAADLRRLAEAVGGDAPLVYNTIYPGGDGVDAAGLEALGVSIALFPGVALQCAAAAMRDGFARLKADPSLAGGAKSPLPASELNDMLGSADFVARFERGGGS